jgi:cell shape-determining protein MreC
MPARKSHVSSLRWTGWGLAFASVLLFALPRRWTGPLINLAQVLVPFQDATVVALDGLAKGSESQGEPIPLETYRALEAQSAAHRRQVAALSARVVDLESDVANLTATRTRLSGSSWEDVRGRLIPARVIAQDLLPWRDSRLLMAGAVHGLQRGHAVTSAELRIEQGDAQGLRPGLAVLLSETLVGWVDQVGSHVSRVQLVSDVGVERKVRVGRFIDSAFEASDRYYWLMGRGRGVMQLRDVERADVESGRVQIGDTVLSDENSDDLPATLVMGTITRIEPDHSNPLLAVATAAPALDHASLRKLYVFDPHGDPQ